MALCLVSPFFIWLLETSNWHRGIGAWLWFGGLVIGGLERLLGSYREAGMRIDIDVAGDIGTVSAAPRIVLHDVLREALTNVAKHASTPEAAIRIRVDLDGVTVRVESALGCTPPRTSTGWD